MIRVSFSLLPGYQEPLHTGQTEPIRFCFCAQGHFGNITDLQSSGTTEGKNTQKKDTGVKSESRNPTKS